jgi:uncharacterized protein
VVTKGRPARTGRSRGDAPAAPVPPLGEREIEALQALLAAVPAPLEPLDVAALDGFVSGILVQPQPVAPARWLPFITDVEGRPLPEGFDPRPLHALVRRRAAELRRAIERREWFDPWVFEIDGSDAADADAASDAAVAAVLPWAAGFTAALETFPALLAAADDALTAPLALLYRHVGTDTLDDAQALDDEIEALEPPADLGQAVEEMVRATLLLADVAGVRHVR